MNPPYLSLVELKEYATALVNLKDVDHQPDCTSKDMRSCINQCDCQDLKSSLVLMFNHISNPGKAPESKLTPTAERKIRMLLDHGLTAFSGLAVAEHAPIYLRSALGSMLVTQIRGYGTIILDSCSETSAGSLPTEPSSSPPKESPSTSACTGVRPVLENLTVPTPKRQRCYGPRDLLEAINRTSSPGPQAESSSGLTDIKGKKPSS
jgi:hypothetical protein